MEAERFTTLRRLYDLAIDLPADARRRALQEQGADAALIDEVLALCDDAERRTDTKVARARDSVRRVIAEPAPAVGDVFGAWRVAGEIGRGGMGRVYRVERSDGHYALTAALKFIDGSASADAIAHFARERQLLARLSHPNISRLLDGGATEQGRPWLVMELVDGVPINEWCRERRPGTTRLIDLFAAVCAAVSHAHRELIVHCDLKPSNILVDARGQPVLLDFGIARFAGIAVDAAADVDVSPGFTPRYASPEQQRGERVGIASDIYSLGLVFSELLDVAGCGDDRELRAIAACASRTEARERYASIDAMVEDLKRYQAHRPLAALPSTLRYRSSKLLQRRWPALLAAAAFVLLAGASLQRITSERATALAERDRALKAERDARASESAALQTSDFLTSLFNGAGPDAGSGNVPTATLIDHALKRVERDLADQPGTQAQMFAALGRVLFLVGQAERGREILQRAIALERGQQRPLVLAKILADYIDLMPGNFPKDLPVAEAREALLLVEQHADAHSLLRLEVTRQVAGLFASNDDHEEATALFERALPLARELVPGSRQLAELLAEFGWHLRGIERYDEAVPLMQESNALLLRLLGEDDPEYIDALATLGGTLALARRHDESDAMFRQSLTLARKTGQIDSRAGAWTPVQYAMMLVDAGRPLEALPLYDEAFAIGARKLAPEHATYAIWNNNRALALFAAGDVSRAVALSRDAVERTIRDFGADHTLTARFLTNFAQLSGDGHPCSPEAGDALARARAIQAAQPKTTARNADITRLEQALWLTGCGRFDDAAALLDNVPLANDADRSNVLRDARARARLRLARDGDEAALQATIAMEQQAKSTFEPGDARAVMIRLPRAEWLHAHGRQNEAAAIAQGMLAELEGKIVPDSPWWARIRRLQ